MRTGAILKMFDGTGPEQGTNLFSFQEELPAFCYVCAFMTKPHRPLDWYNAWLDAWTLAIEAHAVMTLRVIKVATGKDPGGREVRRMATKKVGALLKLQGALITGKFGKNPALAAKKALRHVSSAVEANRRRLS